MFLCDSKCGQVLQAELSELKQRRQELREVLGASSLSCNLVLRLACVRHSKLTKHT